MKLRLLFQKKNNPLWFAALLSSAAYRAAKIENHSRNQIQVDKKLVFRLLRIGFQTKIYDVLISRFAVLRYQFSTWQKKLQKSRAIAFTAAVQ